MESRFARGSVAKYQLIYFNCRGRAQPIRYLFVDNGIQYDYINAAADPPAWLTKIKPSLPFGQLPMLKDGGFELPQTNAILRYLARKHGLHPTDVVESAKVDMINDQVTDTRTAYVTMIWSDKHDEARAEYIKGLPAKLEPFEKILKAWGNDFISKTISFADYNLFDLLDNHLILVPGCLDAFPTLKAFHERMSKRPNIKKMRDSEEFKKLMCSGNGKQ